MDRNKMMFHLICVICSIVQISKLVIGQEVNGPTIRSQSTTSSPSSISSVNRNNNKNNYEIEIKTLTGEPDYKSVNLSWSIEDIEGFENGTDEWNNNPTINNNQKKTFTVFYCELQTWGPHRCKSKLVNENVIDTNDRQNRQYTTVINNLRMATKYLFHVKLQGKPGEQKATGRADLGDNQLGVDGQFQGETIIIPTKGFLAHATKCLPHASEIEVETGPNFAGRIVAEGKGKDCGVDGNYQSSQDKYIMRIDHEKCGSIVDHETLTVKTYITVQENLGIFTHSTRRFVVVCTYQPDTLTVRASFTVPNKNGIASVQPEWETDRSARGRKFQMVGKSALVLKENDADNDSDISENVVAIDENDTLNSIGNAREILSSNRQNKQQNNIENDDNYLNSPSDEKYQRKVSKFARLINNTPAPSVNTNYTALIIVASLSVILIGALLYVLQRETTKRRRSQN